MYQEYNNGTDLCFYKVVLTAGGPGVEVQGDLSMWQGPDGQRWQLEMRCQQGPDVSVEYQQSADGLDMAGMRTASSDFWPTCLVAVFIETEKTGEEIVFGGNFKEFSLRFKFEVWYKDVSYTIGHARLESEGRFS